MGKTPVPKFIYPGDDPELDRLLNEARIEGANDLTSFPDMFGRRGEKTETPKAVGAPGENGATKKPTVSTRPMVTTTKAPAATAASKKQARWLAFGALAIVGPVATLALGALRPRSLGHEVGSGAGAMMATAEASGSGVVKMTAVPGIEEDGGAVPVVPVVPSGAPVGTVQPKPSAQLGPRGPKSTLIVDPYAGPLMKPQKPDPGTDIW